MAEKSFIENAVNSFAIVKGAIGFTDHTGACSGQLSFRHWGTNSGKRQGWVRKSVTLGVELQTSDLDRRPQTRVLNLCFRPGSEVQGPTPEFDIDFRDRHA